MSKPVFAAVLCFGLSAVAAPGLAQEAQPATGQQAQTATEAASPQSGTAEAAANATQLTPEQIAAFNQAVADFGEAQKLQQAGNHAGAAAKYDAALPAIRTAVQVQPENKDYSNFLANALYAAAAAHASLQHVDAALALYKEAVPLWRDMVAANPADPAMRNVLAGMLVQLGNQALGAKDKAAADPYYKEATELARKSVAAAPSDPVVNNLLLSALIGLSQTSGDKAVTDEVLAMGKKMMADGSINAINRPSIEIMTGVKS